MKLDRLCSPSGIVRNSVTGKVYEARMALWADTSAPDIMAQERTGRVSPSRAPLLLASLIPSALLRRVPQIFRNATGLFRRNRLDFDHFHVCRYTAINCPRERKRLARRWQIEG